MVNTKINRNSTSAAAAAMPYLRFSAEGALAVCGAQGVTLLVPQTFGMDENARNRLLNAVGGSSGSETAQLKIILIKK